MALVGAGVREGLARYIWLTADASLPITAFLLEILHTRRLIEEQMELPNKGNELCLYFVLVHSIDRPKLMFANGRWQLGQCGSSFPLMPNHLSGVSVVPASRSNVDHRASGLNRNRGYIIDNC